MTVPPALSAEQRRLAAAKAVRARAVRAAVRQDLTAGRTTLAAVFTAADGDGEHAEAVAAMRVRVLLESLPGVGERRAEAAMVAARVADSRRVRGLGRTQRTVLLARFGPDATAG